MYKGKFDQKSRQSTTDISELVAQRNTEAAARAAKMEAKKAARSAAQKPTAKAVPPAQEPKKASAPAKPQKKGPRLGGVIFYTLYFMFILVFFLGTYIGLNWLNGWLSDYEASQPTVKAEQVFQQLFTNPDWASLYDAADVEDTPYEGKNEYVAHMEEKVGDSKLTYLETSAGLSGGKKYVVRLGDEKVATFTLEDRNNVSDPSLENLEDIGKIADWQLAGVEVFFQRTGSYRIVKTNGHRTLVNGVELDDSFTIQIATTKAEEYLPAGTTGISMVTQEVNGFFAQPTVSIFDDKGDEMQVTYDADTRTFTERTSSNTITAEQEEAIRGAAQTYCLWMIKEVTNRATVAKYFDPSSDTYSSIVRTTELWMQDHNGYSFNDIKISDFTLYNDNLFSARISMSLDVVRSSSAIVSSTDDTIKKYPYAQSMFFQKNDKGNWLCIQATNKDISEPVGKVRLTFMVDDTEVFSNMFQTDATELITPTLSNIPEGMVFSGWARKDVDEKGVITWNVVFQPDESGHVTIPEGNTLTPMTLYALYEDADAVANPAATEGGA